MIVIDEYLAVRVVGGAWPEGLPDDEELALPASRHWRLLQRMHAPGPSSSVRSSALSSPMVPVNGHRDLPTVGHQDLPADGHRMSPACQLAKGTTPLSERHLPREPTRLRSGTPEWSRPSASAVSSARSIPAGSQRWALGVARLASTRPRR